MTRSCSLKNTRSKKSDRGFTIIELLIVLGLLGILTTIVIVSVSSSKKKALVAEAQSDLHQLRIMVAGLENDTDLHPYHFSDEDCTGNEEIEVTACEAGLLCTDGGFPGWDGPYGSMIPDDPWGGTYEFDPDYTCAADVAGCPDAGGYRVLVSNGPNQSATNAYDSDNVVQVICKCPTADCH